MSYTHNHPLYIQTPLGDPERGLTSGIAAVFGFLRAAQKKVPGRHQTIGDSKTAATYSPNWWVSTIGDGELNFSVRNGKRWILTAITTAVYYLREKNTEVVSPLQINFKSSRFACACAIRFSLAILPLGKSFGPLVQVS